MKQVLVTTRSQWRAWLSRNHDREPQGVWLVFHRKGSGKPSLQYEESVEEALCFGWIDSTIKPIDDQTYRRRFTPRRPGSCWSPTNKRRVEKLLKTGRMTKAGLARVEAAKKSGAWEKPSQPDVPSGTPSELSAALSLCPEAETNFEKLSASCRKQYIGWIFAAKRPETKAKRVEKCVTLLRKGRKLGMK